MLRRLLAIPAAVLGVLFAHEMAYRIVASDAHERSHLMAETGHTWLSYVPFLINAALIGMFAAAATGRARNVRSPRIGSILIIQSATYLTVEVIERLVAHTSPWPGWHLVLAGVALQLPVAVVVWALLRFVVIPAVDAVLRKLRRTRGLELTTASFPVTAVTFLTRLLSVRAGRAPPVSLS